MKLNNLSESKNLLKNSVLRFFDDQQLCNCKTIRKQLFAFIFLLQKNIKLINNNQLLFISFHLYLSNFYSDKELINDK